jgi:hypothetical protein
LREVFDVQTIQYGNTGSFCFVGEANDITICKVLFPWLEDVFYNTYYQLMKSGRIKSCAADKNGVWNGMAWGIIEANKREEEKLSKNEQQTMALMVVDKKALIDKRVADLFPRCKTTKIKRQTSDTALGLGYAKGKQINLRQMGGNRATGQLN